MASSGHLMHVYVKHPEHGLINYKDIKKSPCDNFYSEKCPGSPLPRNKPARDLI
jgi:hypothetical protein